MLAGTDASLSVIVGLPALLNDAAVVWAGGAVGLSFKATRVADFSGRTLPSLRQMDAFTSVQRVLVMAVLGTGSLHMMAKDSVAKNLQPLISAA